MIVLIDGYNLIKRILGDKHVSAAERTRFINEIAAYLKQRPMQAYIIFDGGHTAYPETSSHNALTVVFSGYKKSADDYILQYVAMHKEHEILVITDDRELRNLVTRSQKHVLNTYDFYHQYVKKDVKKVSSKRYHDVAFIKTTSYESPELDELMQEASQTVAYKPEEESAHRRVRVREPKKERLRKRMLNKLRR